MIERLSSGNERLDCGRCGDKRDNRSSRQNRALWPIAHIASSRSISATVSGACTDAAGNAAVGQLVEIGKAALHLSPCVRFELADEDAPVAAVMVEF